MLGNLRSTGLRAAAATAAAGALAAASILASAGAASADTTINATYPVTGSTFISAANFTLTLGPGKLVSTADLTTDTISAKLKLPPATGTFTELGLIPVTATTTFINEGPTTGTIDPNTGAISSVSKVKLRLSNVSIAGIPVPVGSACQTATAVKIPVTSQPGFSILAGGDLAGTYTIPDFANCGLSTAILNLTIPGSGNTVDLTLGAAKIKK